MPHINLLPWREEERREKQRQFINVAAGAAIEPPMGIEPEFGIEPPVGFEIGFEVEDPQMPAFEAEVG